MTLPIKCKACGVIIGGAMPGHVHHVIPQAFGGANGPTVDLCSGDHNLLHAVGLRLTSSKPYEDLLVGLNPDHRKVIVWLASRVAVAFRATKNDPNKRVQISMVVTAKTAAKIDRLANIFNVRSRQAAIEHLITEAYSKIHIQR